jgi:transposase
VAGRNVALDQKKARHEKGLVLFEDEASFQLDPTLHRTWARRGVQPRVPTRGERKTAHIYGAIAITNARFTYAFADVFNGKTFLAFLKLLVQRYAGRKIFLIIDNGPCHNLNAEGKAWLEQNAHRVSLHRLPPYSPELNGIEGVWKATRRAATHNRFFANTSERDAALRCAFRAFQRKPNLLDGHVRRFR